MKTQVSGQQQHSLQTTKTHFSHSDQIQIANVNQGGNKQNSNQLYSQESDSKQRREDKRARLSYADENRQQVEARRGSSSENFESGKRKSLQIRADLQSEFAQGQFALGGHDRRPGSVSHSTRNANHPGYAHQFRDRQSETDQIACRSSRQRSHQIQEVGQQANGAHPNQPGRYEFAKDHPNLNHSVLVHSHALPLQNHIPDKATLRQAALNRDAFYHTQNTQGTSSLFANLQAINSEILREEKARIQDEGESKQNPNFDQKGDANQTEALNQKEDEHRHDKPTTTHYSQYHPPSGRKKLQPQQSRNEQSRRKQTRQSDTTGQASTPSSEGGEANKLAELVTQVPQGATVPLMAENKVKEANAELPSSCLLGPQRPEEQGRKTLVLDLDETLVHSSFKPVANAHIQLPVEIDGQVCVIYVLVRPYAMEFLARMHKHFELVIFTASLSKYAEPLMGHLDPTKMCSYLLFREHCTFYNNAFVKDLTRLGRRMEDILIVDNSPVAYLFQPENAIPAVSWYDDPKDTELTRIAFLCERMKQEQDVRRVIRNVVRDNKIDERQEQLYLAATSHRRDKSVRVDRHPRASAQMLSQQPAYLSNPKNFSDLNQFKPDKQVQLTPQNANTSLNEAFIAETTQNATPKQSVSKASQQNSKASSAQKEAPRAHNQRQSQEANRGSTQVNGTNRGKTGYHSRYESSDTRQVHAALVSEQLKQQKRRERQEDDIEQALRQNGSKQRQTKQTQNQTQAQPKEKEPRQEQAAAPQQFQILSSLNSQAYAHHKTQIMQLKNEIEALKSKHINQQSQKGSLRISTANSRQESDKTGIQSDMNRSRHSREKENAPKQSEFAQKGTTQQLKVQLANPHEKVVSLTGPQSSFQAKTVSKKVNLSGQQDIRTQNLSATEKGSRTRTSGVRNSQTNSLVNQISKRTDSSSAYVKQLVAQNADKGTQPVIQKQIVKLIKKKASDNAHQVNTSPNLDINFFGPLGPASAKNQDAQRSSTQVSGKAVQPATTKSQSKQLFGFGGFDKTLVEKLAKKVGSEQPAEQQRASTAGTSRMQPSSRSGAQVSRSKSGTGSSRLDKTSHSRQTGTSQSTLAKTHANGHHSLLHYHHFEDKSHVGQSHHQSAQSRSNPANKRSASVKNQTSRNYPDPANSYSCLQEHRKTGSSLLQNGYSNLAAVLDKHHSQSNHSHNQNHQASLSKTSKSKRERGQSANALYPGQDKHSQPRSMLLDTNYAANGLLLSQNAFQNRSSSTTNKSKPKASLDGGVPLMQNFVIGSQSTKNSGNATSYLQNDLAYQYQKQLHQHMPANHLRNSFQQGRPSSSHSKTSTRRDRASSSDRQRASSGAARPQSSKHPKSSSSAREQRDSSRSKQHSLYPRDQEQQQPNVSRRPEPKSSTAKPTSYKQQNYSANPTSMLSLQTQIQVPVMGSSKFRESYSTRNQGPSHSLASGLINQLASNQVDLQEKNHQQQKVKAQLKEFAVQDMLRLTQQQPSNQGPTGYLTQNQAAFAQSTRHQTRKGFSGDLSATFASLEQLSTKFAGQNNADANDFLKRVKALHHGEADRTQNRSNNLQPRANSNSNSFQMDHLINHARPKKQ